MISPEANYSLIVAINHDQTLSIHILLQCEAPVRYVCWFSKSPSNYSYKVINTINHSDIGVINQLSYLGGLTLYDFVAHLDDGADIWRSETFNELSRLQNPSASGRTAFRF